MRCDALLLVFSAVFKKVKVDIRKEFKKNNLFEFWLWKNFLTYIFVKLQVQINIQHKIWIWYYPIIKSPTHHHPKLLLMEMGSRSYSKIQISLDKKIEPNLLFHLDKYSLFYARLYITRPTGLWCDISDTSFLVIKY